MWGYKPETFCDNQTLLLNPLVRDFSLSLFSDPFVLSIHLQEVTAVSTYMTDNRRVRVYYIHCRYQYCRRIPLRPSLTRFEATYFF